MAIGMRAAGRLDDYRSGHPLIAVVRNALRVDPAVDVGMRHGERAGEYQGRDGDKSRHKRLPPRAVWRLALPQPLNSVTPREGRRRTASHDTLKIVGPLAVGGDIQALALLLLGDPEATTRFTM